MENKMNTQEDRLRVAIKEEQIIVAPESKVDVHIGIINQSDHADYFNILIEGVPSEWITLDTPVVHVAPGEAKQVILSIQTPALLQSRVGQYPLDIRAVSQSDPKHSAAAHTFLMVAAYQSGGRIGIILGSVYFSAAPGSSVMIPMLLQNHGLKEDVFQLNIEGIPANWISTNAVFTKLEPSQSKEVEFTIQVPHSSDVGVGRTPFKVILFSQDFPDQKVEVECILTLAAFSKFSASLQSGVGPSGPSGQLLINNEGNTVDTYSLSFLNPANVLVFEKEVPVSQKGSQPGGQQVETAYVEIPDGEKVQVEPGGQGIYGFRARLRSRPLIGNEVTYPFAIKVVSAENTLIELSADVSGRGFIPPLLAAIVVIIGALALFLLFAISFNNIQTAASATQTAVIEQTQAALPADQQDSDGDGLNNADETKLGTDPFKADTDGDGLPDGQEVQIYKTNPLAADTDGDGLSDGQEVQLYKTNPLIADTDGDGLSDGQEVQKYKTDPLNPDTDKDGLSDGVEVGLGTDPNQADTDKDGLLDGQENQTCPRPLVPDSDGDGIIDGKDLDPCNPNNPSLTATAIAAELTKLPQPTAVPPTNIPTGTPIPTNTVVVLPTNTVVVPPTNTAVVIPTNTAIAAITGTPTFPTLQGTLLFESNRDGNPEIYAMDLSNQSLLRLTNNAAIDMQPAMAPDGQRVAYVSNQNGNNEIYLTGLDRRPPVDLTNNPGDDQQPTWSPDGNWIAFTSNRDGNQEIYIMRSDGSNVQNLTSNPASDFAPTWFSSPGFLGLSSEEWIAFTSNRDGNQEIYKIKPDGTALLNLTRNPANDYSPSSFTNGGTLAFVTDRNGNPEIYTMTSEGGSPTNITNNFSQDLDPAVDPSGKWIAFSSDRDGNMDIYITRLADGATYNLTRNPAQDEFPDW
jgi:TolB protein